VKEVIEAMKTKYPSKFEEIKEIFVLTPAAIASETKQVLMFVKILESLSNLFETSYDKLSDYHRNSYVLEALFKDFCNHLSILSNNVRNIIINQLNLINIIHRELNSC